MKKALFGLFLLFISSCSGYTPLYGELGEQMDGIGLKDVRMKYTAKDIGTRRPAQELYHKLSRIFNNQFDNTYDLYVELEPSESAIATRSDATDKRKSLAVSAQIKLVEVDTNKEVLNTTISRYSSYTVQDEPFATEAAREKALNSIISSLSGDIVQHAALWFRGHVGNEGNK